MELSNKEETKPESEPETKTKSKSDYEHYQPHWKLTMYTSDGKIEEIGIKNFTLELVPFTL